MELASDLPAYNLSQAEGQVCIPSQFVAIGAALQYLISAKRINQRALATPLPDSQSLDRDEYYAICPCYCPRRLTPCEYQGMLLYTSVWILILVISLGKFVNEPLTINP